MMQSTPQGRRGSMELFCDIPLTQNSVHDVPWNSEVIVCRRDEDQTGVFGVGLKIDIRPPNPFMVCGVTDLRDPSGRDISSTVPVGDTLCFCNDRSVVKEGESIIQTTILGEKNSLLKLTLQSQTTGQMYDRLVKRHVPIRTWGFTRMWYEVKDEFRGRELGTHASIVAALDGMRRAVIDSDGREMDFLAGIKKRGSSCGVVLRGRHVERVVPGSPAAVAGVAAGDVIIAADGASSEEGIRSALEGTPRIGTTCRLMRMRGGGRDEVEVGRTQVSAMTRTEELLGCLDDICRDHHAARAALAEHVLQLERERQYEERVMAGRLNRVATELLNHVAKAAATLTPPRRAPEVDVDKLLAPERARADALCGQLHAAEAEAEGLRRENAQLRAELEAARRSMQAMVPSAELETLRRRLEGMVPAEELAGVRRELEGRLAGAEKERAELEARLAALRAEAGGMVARSELEAMERSVAEARAAAEEQRREAEGLRREMAAMVPRADLTAAEAEADRLRGRVAELERAVAAGEEAAVALECEAQAARERAESLQHRVDRLTATVTKLLTPCFDTAGCTFSGGLSVTARGPAGSTLYATVRDNTGDFAAPTSERFDHSGAERVAVQLSASSVVAVVAEVAGAGQSEVRTEQFVCETSSAEAEPEAPPPQREMVGVGMLLTRPAGGGGVFVKEVFEGFGAHADGRIRVGDEVESVDGEGVGGLSMDEVLERVLGPVGSEVTLQMRRVSKEEKEGGAGGEAEGYSVTLQRAKPQELVGVGLLLSRARAGVEEAETEVELLVQGARRERRVVVKEVYAWGSAEASGLVQVGDVVSGIDGAAVGEMGMDEVERRVKGREGTAISLELQRATEGGGWEAVSVVLERRREAGGLPVVSAIIDTGRSLLQGLGLADTPNRTPSQPDTSSGAGASAASTAEASASSVPGVRARRSSAAASFYPDAPPDAVPPPAASHSSETQALAEDQQGPSQRLFKF